MFEGQVKEAVWRTAWANPIPAQVSEDCVPGSRGVTVRTACRDSHAGVFPHGTEPSARACGFVGLPCQLLG